MAFVYWIDMVIIGHRSDCDNLWADFKTSSAFIYVCGRQRIIFRSEFFWWLFRLWNLVSLIRQKTRARIIFNLINDGDYFPEHTFFFWWCAACCYFMGIMREDIAFILNGQRAHCTRQLRAGFHQKAFFFKIVFIFWCLTEKSRVNFLVSDLIDIGVCQPCE